MTRGAKIQSQPPLPAEKAVNDVSRILQVWHQQPLLEPDAVAVEAPHRQSGLENELLEEVDVRMGRLGLLLRFVAAEEPSLAALERDRFLEMVQHHEPPERRGQRGDQLPMEPTGARPADRARCISTKTVGDEPLSFEQLFERIAALPSRLNREGVVRSHQAVTCRTCARTVCFLS